jgi:putative endonuclease
LTKKRAPKKTGPRFRIGAFSQAFRRAASGAERGWLAEERAAHFLERQGFEVLERNVRTRVGEIDLIAVEGEVLCFVEVKARASDGLGSALESVDDDKRRRIARAASLWLARSGWRGFCRFDVIALDRGWPSSGRGDEPEWQITLLRNAFEAEE